MIRPTATATPTSILIATASADRQPSARPTLDVKPTFTATDTTSIAISLPEGLEFLGSGQANREFIDVETAVAAAYLSYDGSRVLYEFFLKHIEDDGWSILDASAGNQSSPQGEISAYNGEMALLIEVWDLEETDISETIDFLSLLWSIDMSPEHIAQGRSLVFTAMLPCSPDLPVDCQ